MKLSNRNKSRVKRVLNITFMILAVGFIVFIFMFKGNMNEMISKKLTEQAGAEVKRDIAQFVDSAFNYQNNGEGYLITFLEFGAKGCISCRKMEKVMKEIKEKYPYKVNVKFYNILLGENQDMIKYFGIAAIPTQVLLNSTGKEIFRHCGYFSTEELDTKIKSLTP